MRRSAPAAAPSSGPRRDAGAVLVKPGRGQQLGEQIQQLKRAQLQLGATVAGRAAQSVRYRQEALSAPKRVRWYMGHGSKANSSLLAHPCARTQRPSAPRNPDAPSGARLGAVAFEYRFRCHLRSGQRGAHATAGLHAR